MRRQLSNPPHLSMGDREPRCTTLSTNMLRCFPSLPIALAFLLWAPLHAQRSPNFVLILADDLGYGDLSAYGAVEHGTPHLDRNGRRGASASPISMLPCHSAARPGQPC